MKKSGYIMVLAATVAMGFTSCKDKNKTDDIIVEKIVAKPQTAPESMGKDTQNGSVAWIEDNKYSYTITRSADDSLAVVENHGRKYHGNKITLVVSRPNGSEFFRKTFTKSNFEPMLPEQFKKTGVLLGMKFEKVDGSKLKFVVSVGSPDDTNEEFYIVSMTLDNFGHTAAEKWVAPSDGGEEE